uniref:Uncharacterized protein n=1 Tax=Labrus bergylta TaxID=56723 RepID=A0A3Q3MLI2_9LABR
PVTGTQMGKTLTGHSKWITWIACVSNLSPVLVLQGQAPERLVSGSDDFTLFLWNPAEDKKYLMSLRGHVGSVYQVAWSADSRLLVSGSSDSTLKVWDVKTGKLNMDLPGHADEVREGKEKGDLPACVDLFVFVILFFFFFSCV